MVSFLHAKNDLRENALLPLHSLLPYRLRHDLPTAFAQTLPGHKPGYEHSLRLSSRYSHAQRPKELMLLAAKSNGMIGDDMKTLASEITYKYLDDQGNVADQGIYENTG